MDSCIRTDCIRPGTTRGYCRSHHAVALRNGTLAPTRIVGDDKARFQSYVEKHREDDCWLWVGRLNHSGYGVFKLRGKYQFSHRVSWEWGHDRNIPEGLLIDHMCHVPACVNPEHLRLATQALNMQNRSGATTRSKSGIRGVYWNRALSKWSAEAMIGGYTHQLGFYEDIDEAERVVVAWRRENMPYSILDQRLVETA